MIDPVGHRADVALHAVPGTGVGSAPARINPLPSVRLDELTAVLAAGPQLSPAQSKQIVALLRATLESFAAPVRAEQSGGALGAFHAATVSLGQLQEDLATRLTGHQEQQQTMAPILRALMMSAGGGDVAEGAALATRSAAPGPFPANGSPAGLPQPPNTRSSLTTSTGFSTGSGASATAPGSPTTSPGSSSVTALARTLAEAIARLEETLGAAGLAATVSPRQARLTRDDRPPVFGQPGQGGRQPAPASSPLPARAEPVGAFRWLLDAAVTLTTAPARPVVTPGEVVRLTSLAHALLDVLVTPSAAKPLPRTGGLAPVAPADLSLPDPEDAAPLQGDLWVTLDRYPGVKSLLGPLLRELGLTVTTAQLAPAATSPQVLEAVLARVQILAVIVLAEAEGVGSPGLYRQILAECEAAGMPRFTLPLDASDNIETYRWLLIAAQLYNSRVVARPPLQRCTRCGRILQRSRTGVLICPSCS